MGPEVNRAAARLRRNTAHFSRDIKDGFFFVFENNGDLRFPVEEIVDKTSKDKTCENPVNVWQVDQCSAAACDDRIYETSAELLN